MPEPLHCLVEIPKGSRNKYEWDERLGRIERPEGKEVQVDGWRGRELALRIVEESCARLREASS